ncbi:12906_t:CDS:2 [Funneliformis caledonium]|uniref:12906_t:CDS:1 n=1 Tax=Funneliformis caledonium TaxID=1117310 RepID=A0A9N9HNW9_9GLOM|nr:12906_t:CDS:2 [Funneliformis caledonium]
MPVAVDDTTTIFTPIKPTLAKPTTISIPVKSTTISTPVKSTTISTAITKKSNIKPNTITSTTKKIIKPNITTSIPKKITPSQLMCEADQISKRQDELETIIIEQKDKIDEILSKFEEHKFNTEIGNSKKEGKDKGKKNRIEFYQLFHEYKQLTDNELKVRLKDDEDEQYEEEKEVQDSSQYSEYASTDKELYNLYQSLENDANFMD